MVETACPILMSLILSVTGILLVVPGRRMTKRRLPPNSRAGVRYEITLRSEENWYTMQARYATAIIGVDVVPLDSAVLFVVQVALHETISILFPMAIILIQTVADIAFVHVQARRCATELTQSAQVGSLTQRL